MAADEYVTGYAEVPRQLLDLARRYSEPVGLVGHRHSRHLHRFGFMFVLSIRVVLCEIVRDEALVRHAERHHLAGSEVHRCRVKVKSSFATTSIT